MSPRSPRALLFLASLACSVAQAQAPRPDGPELRISPGDGGRSPQLCRTASGGTVVVWSELHSDFYDAEIHAQRLDPLGQPLGSSFQVNTHTPSWQLYPAVGCDAAGGFAVAWLSTRGANYRLAARRFDAQGVAVTDEFVVSERSPVWWEASHALAMAPDGQFLVAWHDEVQLRPRLILARRFDSSGLPLGDEFVVSQEVSIHNVLSASVDALGNTVLVWLSSGKPPEYRYTFVAQRIDRTGQLLGEPVAVNPDTLYSTARPALAVNDSGEFVVAWEAGGTSSADGPTTDIFARRFDSSGQPMEEPFLVNTYTTGIQSEPAVSAGPAGDFVVAWTDRGYCTQVTGCDFYGGGCTCVEYVPGLDVLGSGIFAQSFGAAGTPQGELFQAAPRSLTAPVTPAVAHGAREEFLVLWYDHGSAGPAGVFGQRFVSDLPGEFQVNASTALDQSNPALSCQGEDGITVWQSAGQDGSGDGIYGRIHDPYGAPLGAEFRVNGTTRGDQQFPSVERDAAGNALVVWQSAGQDGSGWGVYGRRLDAAGRPRGREFRLSSVTAGDQALPSVAVRADGSFWAAWQGPDARGRGTDVYARRYDGRGRSLGREFRVNTAAAGDQGSPALCLEAAGGAVLVWEGPDGRGLGVFGQRYDAGGKKLGRQFRVNGFTTSDQFDAAVACSPHGGFAVAWTSAEQDGDAGGVWVRRYAASGRALGRPARVKLTAAGDQGYAAVAYDAGGQMTIVWESFGQDGDRAGLYVRHYDADGRALGGELPVNENTALSQGVPAICSDAGGSTLVVWQDGAADADGQDGSGWGIFGRRLSLP